MWGAWYTPHPANAGWLEIPAPRGLRPAPIKPFSTFYHMTPLTTYGCLSLDSNRLPSTGTIIHKGSSPFNFFNFSTWAPYSGAFFSRWLTWYSLFSQKYSFWSATMWLKSWKLPALGGEKIKIWKSLQIGVRNLLNDERIPNLVSELKLDNIWPPFGRKLAKYTILPFIWYAEFYHSLLWKYIYSHPVHLLQYDSKCNTQMRNKYFFTGKSI